MGNVEPYTIHTEAFEGPLDLLLSLIEKRKLLINDISLAEVSNDYLRYLEQHPGFPMAETAQFILVGSALLLIKSKSLLPVISLTSEEQGSIEDLERRLKVLELFQRTGRNLHSVFDIRRLYAGVRKHRTRVEFSPLSDSDPHQLHQTMVRVLQNLPELKPKLAETTVLKVVSLEQMMERLTERINDGMQVSFREFAGGGPEGRINLIVSFLAMLELVRQGIIRVEQEGRSGDIHMERGTVGVPRYG